MDRLVTALIGAVAGPCAIRLGMRLHFGSWYVDGPWGYIGAAVAGALVALLIRWTMRRELGSP